MAFDKKTWANNQGGGTPLDASGLNDLENRISNEFDILETSIDDIIPETYIGNGSGIILSSIEIPNRTVWTLVVGGGTDQTTGFYIITAGVNDRKVYTMKEATGMKFTWDGIKLTVNSTYTYGFALTRLN